MAEASMISFRERDDVLAWLLHSAYYGNLSNKVSFQSFGRGEKEKEEKRRGKRRREEDILCSQPKQREKP